MRCCPTSAFSRAPSGASAGTSSYAFRFLNQLAKGMRDGLLRLLRCVAQIVRHAPPESGGPLRFADVIDDYPKMPKVEGDVIYLRRSKNYRLLCCVRETQFIEYVRVLPREISQHKLCLLDLLPNLLDDAASSKE